jgi:hypothetical protein
MRESSRNWMEKVTRKIGMGGSVDFTTTAVGQTLHIPCRQGDHFVDFPIPAHLPPDIVVKKMLAAGWTVGNHPKCPDCSRSARSQKASAAGKASAAKRLAGMSQEQISAAMSKMAKGEPAKSQGGAMEKTVTAAPIAHMERPEDPCGSDRRCQSGLRTERATRKSGNRWSRRRASAVAIAVNASGNVVTIMVAGALP